MSSGFCSGNLHFPSKSYIFPFGILATGSVCSKSIEISICDFRRFGVSRSADTNSILAASWTLENFGSGYSVQAVEFRNLGCCRAEVGAAIYRYSVDCDCAFLIVIQAVRILGSYIRILASGRSQNALLRACFIALYADVGRRQIFNWLIRLRLSLVRHTWSYSLIFGNVRNCLGLFHRCLRRRCSRNRLCRSRRAWRNAAYN